MGAGRRTGLRFGWGSNWWVQVTDVSGGRLLMHRPVDRAWLNLWCKRQQHGDHVA